MDKRRNGHIKGKNPDGVSDLFDCILFAFELMPGKIVLRDIYKTFTLRGIGTLWFLPAIFFGEAVARCFIRGELWKKSLILALSVIYSGLYYKWDANYGNLNEMYRIIDTVEPHMPKDKPRYLMGVGTPANIIEAVARGVDFFDCVMPARNARHARLFTWEGAINLKNAKYQNDLLPIDPQCDCPVCRRYSRAYIRHLFVAEEMLAMRLSVMHNLYFYNKLMERIRDALDNNVFGQFKCEYSEKLSRRI